MPTKELLAFSEYQQQAVVGHLLQQHNIWEVLEEFGVNEKWLAEGALADFWHQLELFKKQYDRLPLSSDEIVDFVLDPQLKGATQRTITKCVEAKKKHPWDALSKKLTGWAKSRVTFTATKELVEKFNAGKHEEAYQLFDKSSLDLQRIDCFSGFEQDGFVPANIRIKGEKERRALDAQRVIKYSIPYLQDITGGMLPTEVVLWGATSGAGKTEAAKLQAAYTAKTLKEPVHYFALEAEPEEIERRIKYGIMGREYKNTHQGVPSGLITYQNYRQNRLIEELDEPYGKLAEDEFDKNYSTLNVYYRKKNEFGPDKLEKELWKLKGKSRLIILDHVHYLDLEDDKNETEAMSKLMKRIRGMGQVLEIPIILIAHLPEKGNHHGDLIPRKDDYYGASNLFKVATTAIMMAPARKVSSTDSKAFGVPTFMKIVKGRLNNAAQYYPGISFFNTFTSDYTPFYAVGKIENGGKKWVPLKGELPSWVNIDAYCSDINEID